jgi:hypothetical protein
MNTSEFVRQRKLQKQNSTRLAGKIGVAQLINNIKDATTANKINLMVQNSYKNNDRRDENINGYVLDKNLSNDYAVIYHNPKIGRTAITHRGKESTIKDWSNNVMYVLNLHI